ncbi:MAG: hypothetical protein HY751_13015 [Nitrospinae bacterium]|nr:hypothetical protein [Nitrospinota bacterium]
MLLYVVEADIPILVWLLGWALVLAMKGDHEKHKKVAIWHGVATWASAAIVFVLVRMGFRMGQSAPEWILDLHLNIIYTIPPLLILLAITAMNRKSLAHKGTAAAYLMLWAAALVTGGMIFAMDRGWIQG